MGTAGRPGNVADIRVLLRGNPRAADEGTKGETMTATAGHYKGPVGPDPKFLASLIVIIPTTLILLYEIEIFVLECLIWLGIIGGG